MSFLKNRQGTGLLLALGMLLSLLLVACSPQLSNDPGSSGLKRSYAS